MLFSTKWITKKPDVVTPELVKEERQFLEERFGASPVTATPTGTATEVVTPTAAATPAAAGETPAATAAAQVDEQALLAHRVAVVGGDARVEPFAGDGAGRLEQW